MLGDKVFLETWVKVKKNWRDKKLDLADFGYNEKNIKKLGTCSAFLLEGGADA